MRLERAESIAMERQPDLILLGYGTGDGSHLTLEAQRAISQAAVVYSLGAPPSLTRRLKSMRAKHTELSESFKAGRPYSETYLEIADLVLRRAAEEPPVALISPGNPLFLNSLNRFLVMQARERDIAVQVLAGVSPVDVIVNDLGLDVSTFGLQLFDATRLVRRRLDVDPGAPLLLLQLGGFARETVPDPADERAAELYLPLVRHLARFYPPDFPATLMNLGAGSGRVTRPLAAFPELVPHIGMDSHLFLDAMRRPVESRPPEQQ